MVLADPIYHCDCIDMVGCNGEEKIVVEDGMIDHEYLLLKWNNNIRK